MSLEGILALDSEDKIVEHFNGDKELATMWKSFVLHNKWVTINSQGRYVITEKGKRWIRRILQPLVAGLHSFAAFFVYSFGTPHCSFVLDDFRAAAF